MATKKKSSAKAAKATTPAKPAAKPAASWASTIKQALQKKQGGQGWPTEATGKSHAKQSAAHAKLGRKNPPK